MVINTLLYNNTCFTQYNDTSFFLRKNIMIEYMDARKLYNKNVIDWLFQLENYVRKSMSENKVFRNLRIINWSKY